MAASRTAHEEVARIAAAVRLHPGAHVALPHDRDPSDRLGFESPEAAAPVLEEGLGLLVDLQARLAAQDVHALLVVLQGPDASGKDGAISHVMRGMNPQGVQVRSFKVPSVEERDHDFLWRYACHLPARGVIGIFNRSHYEEVLVVRVHPEALAAERVPAPAKGAALWTRRFREINDWERYLVDNGIHVVKLFLNLSRDEQRRRLLERIDHPDKNWKFSAADLVERARWHDYQHAYAEMLRETGTRWAPWHVIPADHKWAARLAVAAVVAQALIDIDPQYPRLDAAQRASLAKARTELTAGG